jgi:chloramphenicol O-acetyltransferase type A
VRFTALSHARSFRYADSCPKISYGQVYLEGATRLLPISVHIHHGLADGYHVGLFLEAFQRRLNAGSSVL